MNASTGAESKGRVPTAAQAQASTAAGGALQSVIFFRSTHPFMNACICSQTQTEAQTHIRSFTNRHVIIYAGMHIHVRLN